MPGRCESPVAYTTTSTPRAVSALASSAMTSSVPPYPLGGTGTKGVDTSAMRRAIPPSGSKRRKDVHCVTAGQRALAWRGEAPRAGLRRPIHAVVDLREQVVPPFHAGQPVLVDP